MPSLLNMDRPPAFCPGCSHERVVHALDRCFQNMDLRSNQAAIVSDIGCSGLFDTFFHTHTFHGLHGRALTYGTGIKMARPGLNVVVIMGDGGLGIGSAHFISACRRNLDLTLLILNNFNFGMTGGQFSATTPAESSAGSGFLNRLERPLDVCQLAYSAGASYINRCSSFNKRLPEEIEKAVNNDGFSVLDIWGLCTGRYTKQNRLTPQIIEEDLAELPSPGGNVPGNARKEYGRQYRELAESQKHVSHPVKIDAGLKAPDYANEKVVILGSAGQRIKTAGEILCLAGLTAGLKVSQKNEFDVTVLRGPSISELILSQDEILYTGIEKPSVIAVLGKEGVARRKSMFEKIDHETLIIQDSGIEVPASDAKILQVDFRGQQIKNHDWSLAFLAVLAKLKRVINPEMLMAALEIKYKDQILKSAVELAERVSVNSQAFS